MMEADDASASKGELLKRAYSDDEIAHLYEFGRVSLENGRINRADAVFQGLVQVAPDFAPAWLGLAYIHALNSKFDEAVFASRQALRIDPNLYSGMLYLAAFLLTTGDYHAAGTQLGEIGERVEAGMLGDPNLIRFFRVQLARFQNREGSGV